SPGQRVCGTHQLVVQRSARCIPVWAGQLPKRRIIGSLFSRFGRCPSAASTVRDPGRFAPSVCPRARTRAYSGEISILAAPSARHDRAWLYNSGVDHDGTTMAAAVQEEPPYERVRKTPGMGCRLGTAEPGCTTP